MCMCRSTSINGRAASRRADRAGAADVVPAGGQAGVDLLELVGHARPAELRAQGRRALAEPSPQLRVGDQAVEVGGERLGIAGLEHRARTRPRRAAPRRRGSREATGTTPPASARTSVPGAGLIPSEASTSTSAPASASASDTRSALDELDALASARLNVAGAAQRPRRPDRRPPRCVGWERAQRAQEDPERAALLAGDEQQLARDRAPVRLRRAPTSAPGGSRGSRPGSSAGAGPGSRRSWRCGRRAGRTAAATAGR